MPSVTSIFINAFPFVWLGYYLYWFFIMGVFHLRGLTVYLVKPGFMNEHTKLPIMGSGIYCFNMFVYYSLGSNLSPEF